MPTTGTPITTPGGKAWPRDIAIDNEGVVIVAASGGVVAYPLNSNEPRTLAKASLADLQWDAIGARLLVAAPEGSAILGWPAGDVVHDLDARGVNGALQWAPDAALRSEASDVFDPDASQPIRVLIRVSELSIDGTGTPRELLTEPRRLATIGTLPALGRAWAHPTTLYQILPDPHPFGPLMTRFSLGGTRPDQSGPIR